MKTCIKRVVDAWGALCFWSCLCITYIPPRKCMLLLWRRQGEGDEYR